MAYPSVEQFSLEDGDGLAAEAHAIREAFGNRLGTSIRPGIAFVLHLDDTAPGRGLVGKKRAFAQLLAPVGTKTAVGRPGHRIFVDAKVGRKKARDKIVRRFAPARDRNAVDGELLEGGEIRR